MAPVCTSPTRLPDGPATLSSPKSQPIILLVSSSPSFPRPATPWPQNAPTPDSSSHSLSPSSDSDFPPLSAASCRRAPSCSPKSSSSTSTSLVSGVLPAHPNPVSIHPAIPKSGVDLNAYLSSPSPFGSCVPDEVILESVKMAMASARPDLADSFLIESPSSNGSKDVSTCCGIASHSTHHHCTKGPPPFSADPLSGILDRPVALVFSSGETSFELLNQPVGPVPFPDSESQVGSQSPGALLSTSLGHVVPSLVASPMVTPAVPPSCADGTVPNRTLASCPSDDPVHCNPCASWASVVEK